LTGGLSTEGLEDLGVHPDTCSVGFEAGKVAGYGGLLVPGFGEEEVATEGIYVIEGAEGTYVGQSGAIATRLAQHVASGRFTQAEVDSAMRVSVSGGRVAREVAEQQMVDSLGGIKGLLNLRNPIGPQRLGLMPQPYTRFWTKHRLTLLSARATEIRSSSRDPGLTRCLRSSFSVR
jgi:hypothetical protein